MSSNTQHTNTNTNSTQTTKPHISGTVMVVEVTGVVAVAEDVMVLGPWEDMNQSARIMPWTGIMKVLLLLRW